MTRDRQKYHGVYDRCTCGGFAMEDVMINAVVVECYECDKQVCADNLVGAMVEWNGQVRYNNH
jgi:hypothetical protein